MKKSKFLFVLPLAIVSIAPIVSCGTHGLTINDFEDAIFHPCSIPTPKPDGCDSYIKCLSSLNEKELQKELIYSIYSYSIFKTTFGEKTISQFWKDNVINMSANVSKCSLNIQNNSVYANFRGYINFIFSKDYESFKKNDSIQITFAIDNENVTPANESWYLNYRMIDPTTDECWGIFQVVCNGKTTLRFINNIGSASMPIKNWHNWS